MKDNHINYLIKKHDYKNALKEMEDILKNVLLKKINNANVDDYSLMQIIEYYIINYSEYYDIMTYLRNLYYYANKSELQKLYELAYIYEALIKY